MQGNTDESDDEDGDGDGERLVDCPAGTIVAPPVPEDGKVTTDNIGSGGQKTQEGRKSKGKQKATAKSKGKEKRKEQEGSKSNVGEKVVAASKGKEKRVSTSKRGSITIFRVIIRLVWAHNVEEELALIASSKYRYPIISVDTEFPGVIFHSDKHYSTLTISERYSLMKLNVDALNLIQLGFTLSDPSGNLLDLGSSGLFLFAWEFNFNDFNLNSDLHSPDSINLLRSSGVDFERNRMEGIDSHWFACLLVN
ncbi:hypothetical protein J5N97_020956 [Dioscorea zingiberensis]|uniref:poly(A)-specific ribonuclease n=1 Tax=Dioscorea zingiberensis TaxID=325984 RepID=A0A9D5CGR9_9LILI|nr:hypothetical protein J5N97_020956 [Dioscorea zingiberensis]